MSGKIIQPPMIMKSRSITIIAMLLTASISATVAQSQFSGIYKGTSGRAVFSLALTKGGRALGFDSKIEGPRDALDPAKSTVSAAGKLKAATPTGATIVATVSSTYQLRGTIKIDNKTYTLSGNRIYK